MEAVSAFTLSVCTPIYWHCRTAPFPKKLIGGSCLVLQFADRFVGVTAAHVLSAYETALSECRTVTCQLRLMEFDFSGAVIDRDSEWDIVTFALSTSQLEQAEIRPVDCREDWPPPTSC